MALIPSMRFRFATAVLAAGMIVIPWANAQTYPAKPIRLVIGSFPGGGIDLAGRIVAQKMSENIGHQVIVDNRGGANGIIGMDTVAKSAPDGYTFYMGTAGHISVNPSMYAEIRKALDHPDVRSKLASHGFAVDGRAPEQFRTFRKSEEARWARVIKEAGIQQQ